MPPTSEQFYESDEAEEASDGSPTESEVVTSELGRLQITNARLNAEIRALKGTGASSTASSTISTKAAASEETLLHRGYRNHGKHFAALSELWVKSSVLRRPYPERFRTLGPWHPERCADNISWEEGTVAELYSILPESCHDLIENSALFSKMFIKGAKDFRSYLIDNVRKRAVAIFSIDSVTEVGYYAASAGSYRSQMPAFANLLKDPKKPNEEYAVFPPVLFTDYEVVKTELFGSAALLKILKVILLGPTSLDPIPAKQTNPAEQAISESLDPIPTKQTNPANRPGPKGYAYHWGMKTITPGCIAMAAVVAQFMLSPDPAFSETGSITKIKYGDRFKQYKKLIVKVLETPRMKALFARLNEELFPVNRPEPRPSISSTRGASEDEDDFARAFNDEGIQGGSATELAIPAPSPAPTTSVEPTLVLPPAPTPVKPTLGLPSTPAPDKPAPSVSNRNPATPAPLINSSKSSAVVASEDEATTIPKRATRSAGKRGRGAGKRGRGAPKP